MATRAPRSSTTGFTLAESLAVLTILGLLMTAGLGTVRIAQTNWRAEAEQGRADHDPQASFEFLRRQFASLTPTTYLSGERLLIAFVGARDSVRFIAPAPEDSPGAGLMTLTLALEQTRTGTDVWLDLAALDPGSEAWPSPVKTDRIPLLQHLEGARLAYLGAPHDDDPFIWHETWPEDATSFPEAVKLVADRSGKPVPVPDFHFPIQAERWR